MRRRGKAVQMFKRSSRSEAGAVQSADDAKLAVGVLAAVLAWFLGAPVGADAESEPVYDTKGKASTAGNDVRVALANRGIWLRSESFEVLSDDGPARYGYLLTVVPNQHAVTDDGTPVQGRFVDRTGKWAEVQDAEVPVTMQDADGQDVPYRSGWDVAGDDGPGEDQPEDQPDDE
jgi:hypothetical protein